MRLRPLLVACTLLAVLVPAVSAQAQASRTWVSGTGDDVNPCSLAAPCKTFAGAISKTAEGGEINAKDSGGFGSVTITKALTIDTRSAHGGIAAGGGSGITINAGADDDVVLRGLDINGHGPTFGSCSPYGGYHGVSVLAARSVRIEDTAIGRFGTTGLRVVPTTADTKVLVNRVDISQSCGEGINVAPGAGRKADVTVTDSSIFQTGTGLRAAEGAHVWLRDSTIFGNAVGLATAGNGIIDSYWGTNQIAGNTTDGAPTNVLDAPPAPGTTIVKETVVERVPTPVAAAPASTPAPAPVVVPPVAVSRCVVPSLTGLTLAKARARLVAADCTLGRVTRRTTRSTKRIGRVTAQRTKAGSRLAAGRAVAVTVGRRRAR